MSVIDKQINVMDAEVGSRLRFRREELRLTKGQLALVLSTSEQSIDDLERGVLRLRPALMFAAAAKLGVPVSYFFAGLSRGL